MIEPEAQGANDRQQGTVPIFVARGHKNGTVPFASSRSPAAGPQRNPRAFTLVEMLVVITIIGVLMALLLPAVMATLEAGRRARCLNNIHQICIANAAYETVNRIFPMNWGVVPTTGQATSQATTPSIAGLNAVGHSWMSMILPQLDENVCYSHIVWGQPIGCNLNTGQDNTNDANGAAGWIVRTFVCPSDNSQGKMSNQALGTGVWATTNYKACAGMNWIVTADPVSSTPLGPSKPAAWGVGRNAGSTDGLDHGNGFICRGGGPAGQAADPTKSPPVLFVPSGGAIITGSMDIRDGLSKTFAVGEAIPQFCAWSVWYWFDGATATCGLPLNYKKPGVQPASNATDWMYTYSFMSRHPGGANFGMCDGSGTFISNTIAMNVYWGMATIDGRELVDVPPP